MKAFGTLINDGPTEANNRKVLLLKTMLIKPLFHLKIHISFIFQLINKKQQIDLEYSNTIINKEW